MAYMSAPKSSQAHWEHWTDQRQWILQMGISGVAPTNTHRLDIMKHLTLQSEDTLGRNITFITSSSFLTLPTDMAVSAAVAGARLEVTLCQTPTKGSQCSQRRAHQMSSSLRRVRTWAALVSWEKLCLMITADNLHLRIWIYLTTSCPYYNVKLS